MKKTLRKIVQVNTIKTFYVLRHNSKCVIIGENIQLYVFRPNSKCVIIGKKNLWIIGVIFELWQYCYKHYLVLCYIWVMTVLLQTLPRIKAAHFLFNLNNVIVIWKSSDKLKKGSVLFRLMTLLQQNMVFINVIFFQIK